MGRQIHHPENHLRHSRSPQGSIEFKGQTSPPATRHSSCSRAWSTCPRGAKCFRCSPCATTCSWAPTPARTAMAWHATWRWCMPTSPSSRNARSRMQGFFGRAAADAGHLARPHGQPRSDPARRAQPGPVPKLTKEIFEIVVRINRERGTTILLVEQNANMALNASDYGYVLEKRPHRHGRQLRPPARKEDIKEFYLGMKEEGVRGERRWKKKRHGGEPMSNLWDVSHIQPRNDIVVPGETIPAVFWNAVALRGNRSGCGRRNWASGAAGAGSRPAMPCARSPVACWPWALSVGIRPPSWPIPWSNGCWPIWPCSVAAVSPMASTPPMRPPRCTTCARTRAPRAVCGRR